MDGRKGAVSRGPGAEGGRSNQVARRQTRGWRKGWASLGREAERKVLFYPRSSGKRLEGVTQGPDPGERE